MRVLVVEDEPVNLKLLKEILQTEGFDVLYAEDGRQAVEVARAELPDLILMDIRMPGMDGFQAVKLLKSDDTTRNIPVVAVTAYAMKEDRERATEAGFDDYLTKPFRYEEVVEKVRRFLKEG